MNKTKGAEQPNFTQAPNAFFDDLLPQIKSLCELKITLAIIRQTFGWRKTEDQLSVSKLEKLTGLSRKGVQDGLNLALERGSITRRAKGQKFFYALKLCNDIARFTPPTMQPSTIEPCNDIARELCNDIAPQKKEEKKAKETPTETQGVPDTPFLSEPSTTAEAEWWRYGAEVLTVEGESQKSARALLGRESKRHSKQKILEALQRTERQKPAEPKSYFLGILKQQTAKDEFYTDLIASIEAQKVERERERREHPTTYQNSEGRHFSIPLVCPPRAA